MQYQHTTKHTSLYEGGGDNALHIWGQYQREVWYQKNEVYRHNGKRQGAPGAGTRLGIVFYLELSLNHTGPVSARVASDTPNRGATVDVWHPGPEPKTNRSRAVSDEDTHSGSVQTVHTRTQEHRRSWVEWRTSVTHVVHRETEYNRFIAPCVWFRQDVHEGHTGNVTVVHVWLL